MKGWKTIALAAYQNAQPHSGVDNPPGKQGNKPKTNKPTIGNLMAVMPKNASEKTQKLVRRALGL